VSIAILGLELRFRARAVASAALGLVALTALVGSLYPSLGDSIADVEIPKEIGDFIGGSDLATIQGWLRAEIMAVYGPVVFAVIAITSATATTAGEEEGHVLALVLAKPVPRRRLLLAKAAAIALLLGALSVAVLVGLRIAVAIAGGGVATAHLAAAALHLLAFGLGVGALALALGAGTGQRGLAAGVAAGITLVMYLVNGIAPVSDATSWLRYLTLFHYYEGGDPIANGIDAAGLAVLVLVTTVLLSVAVVAFERRDLRG
jgi:ABC-2 type transport system permease protein